MEAITSQKFCYKCGKNLQYECSFDCKECGKIFCWIHSDHHNKKGVLAVLPTAKGR